MNNQNKFVGKNKHTKFCVKKLPEAWVIFDNEYNNRLAWPDYPTQQEAEKALKALLMSLTGKDHE